MNRLTIILVACVLVGGIALGVAKRKANQLAAKQTPQQTTAQAPKPEAAAAVGKVEADPNAPRPIGHGLTYALIADRNPDAVTLSCHGEPAPTDRPHKNSCNPYQGDTSCRTVLPVLCMRAGAAPAPTAPAPAAVSSGPGAGYSAWTGGTLGAAPALMGAILESEAYAHAYCEKELGPGWRMAEFQDGAKGWALQGQRSLGLSQNQRHWVLSRNQPANCWNSKP